MEYWEFEFKWLEVRHKVKEAMGYDKPPELNAVLFLVGIQELGQLKEVFTKEEKQDLMHIAVCRLLSYEGYYEFEGIDSDGWPHWKVAKPLTLTGVKEQEQLLKELLVRYFNDLNLPDAAKLIDTEPYG